MDTFYFAYPAKLMPQVAAAIGRTKEAAACQHLFQRIKSAFAKKYLKADGSLTLDNETAYALAVYKDLIPVELRLKSGKILADKLRAGETADNSGMTTGFLGTRPVLTCAGENDLALKHFQSRKFPSWGYEVEQGATTIWEHWDSYAKAHGFGGMDGNQDASMNSFAHYSFGAGCEWMINDLAGIQSDGPGYDKILIHPHPATPGSNAENQPIWWVKAHYDSILGRIVSNWKRIGNRFELETEIPPNTTATVCLPTVDRAMILEDGQPLAKVNNVRLLRVEGGCAVMAVESGKHHFVSTPP